MFVRYKRRRMIKDLSDQQRSLIKREDIAMHDRLGRGAAGEVFRGTFRGTEVAVKKLLASATSQAAVEQFEIETAIMTSLRHPNIVLFMGVCLVKENNEMLLVMELMEKGSLHDIIHNPKIKLPFSLCLHISYQAAKGMNFLHQSDPPIIHCDLKSHNILMDDKWNAKISDFGITRFKTINQKKDKDQQSSGSSLGTIYWTAPEVLAGKGHSEASDVYSFGIVLWEIFHRETPYKGKEPMLVVMEVQANMRPILKLDLEPAIRDLIIECWNENPAVRPKFDDIMNRLRDLNSQSPMSAYGLHESIHGDAPTGVVYLVATEVLGANEMWDKVPMDMCQAMVLHNKLIRSTVDTHNGFEAEFVKNGFFLAFRTLKDVMNWCLAAQSLLVSTKWPAKLSTLVREDDLPLRVKMAVHVGVPNCQTNHNGTAYYSGPIADRTRKILSSSSTSNTFILVSRAIMEQINSKGIQFTDGYTSNVFGETIGSARSTDSLSGKAEEIYEIVPNSLAKYHGRAYMHTPTEVPNAVVMEVDEMELIPSVSKRPLKWDIPYSDLREYESVGKGAIGDYIRTMWKDREVVQKVLLNQQIGEEDQLLLKARASVLTKLNHKNLLDFYGICLEPNKISLVIAYMPKSSLNALLYDSTFSLSYNSKVKLVKQIADGMDYLYNISEHPWLAMNGNLKSCNVLVQRDSLTVKLCDFGQGNLKDLARTMTSVGTVAWTAPEILNGEDLTPKITVYSFAIIMWEIYTRAFPYQNEHPIKAVTKIVAGYRPPIPADCPAPYKELMTRCWAIDPEQRPGWSEIVATLSTM
eukprot:Phypoly_transcript_00671.p1 GENE.Phypoly_transcript_00671~~Phypoly_transcript_00671.p1  ORF type:complete len:807 (+),score=131.97 Phypoly_transcript_00671:1680-4100(+)